jgi:hypothetical protein
MAHVLRATLLVLAVLVSGSAADEAYPTRPVTIVVPFPPGGIADLTARPLAPALERILKQPVVVANKAGAAGAVGMQSVAVAKADGYTLLLGLVSISTIPEVDALFGRPPAFRRDQFVGIARLNADPPLLVVGAETPWKSLGELVDDARRRPGEIAYASSGLYGASHVPMEMLLHHDLHPLQRVRGHQPRLRRRDRRRRRGLDGRGGDAPLRAPADERRGGLGLEQRGDPRRAPALTPDRHPVSAGGAPRGRRRAGARARRSAPRTPATPAP